jgi:pimeloyl-ACP methyl ester carboxylesterase
MSVPTTVDFDGAGGVCIRADRWGEPAGPPVILLHGGGQTRHAWRGTARRLAAAGFHAIAVDLRGHGDTDRAPDGDYSLDAFANDLRAIASRLDRPPAVVGASLGGIAGLLAEGETPGLTAAIVLVDVAPRMEEAGMLRIVAFMTARPDGFADLDEAADTIADYLPHRPRPTDLSGLAKNLRRGVDGRWHWHWDPAFLTSDRRPGAMRDPARLAAAARSLRVPTLLVRGGSSDLVSEESAADLLALQPAAEYVDVSGAGHMVAGDRNDVFSDAVVDFLCRVLEPSGLDSAHGPGEAGGPGPAALRGPR